MGTFYRTIRLLENGIKPVYVFDGKPPQMKSSELEKRADRRQEAQKSLEKAEEAGIVAYCYGLNYIYLILSYCFVGDATGIDKFSKRLVKVTSIHTTECKELLKLMGVPFVEVCLTFIYLINMSCASRKVRRSKNYNHTMCDLKLYFYDL